MASGKEKSGTRRKLFKRVTSGTISTYEKAKPKQAGCSLCGEKLRGVPRLKRNKSKNGPKTSKRPERPYGGNLCPKCMRAKIKEKVRKEKI